MKPPQRKQNRPSLTSLVAFVMLTSTLYVLSYAPYSRVRYGPSSEAFSYAWDYSPHEAGYRPVEWLIDRTPARKPLLRWAQIWSVEHRMARDSASRRNWSEQSAE